MATSAASLYLPTITVRSKQALFSPYRVSLLSLKPNSNPLISISATSLHFHRARPSLPSRFVSNVALSSDFDQEEEVLSDGDEPSYSSAHKLFVGNLPFSVDSAQLAELFENAGSVEMVEVIYDKMTGRSRGFGFVTMSSAQEVKAAAQQFDGYELDGRALRVNSGPPPSRREIPPFRASSRRGTPSDENRLHVSNLAWGVDNVALESFFGEYGNVLEARVIYDRESGRSKGFGFVTLSSSDEVNSAMRSLNGVDLGGRPIRISIANARPPRQF